MSEKKLFHEVPKSADFHSVVMTTYSFDFHHFESQVLRPLKKQRNYQCNYFCRYCHARSKYWFFLQGI